MAIKKQAIKRGENRLLEDYVVIDLEMTGLNAKTDAILEVGAVRVRDGRQTETYGAILKCGRELSERVVELTGITPEMAADGREPEEFWKTSPGRNPTI